jgi:hypothetical protein
LFEKLQQFPKLRCGFLKRYHLSKVLYLNPWEIVGLLCMTAVVIYPPCAISQSTQLIVTESSVCRFRSTVGESPQPNSRSHIDRRGRKSYSASLAAGLSLRKRTKASDFFRHVQTSAWIVESHAVMRYSHNMFDIRERGQLKHLTRGNQSCPYFNVQCEGTGSALGEVCFRRKVSDMIDNIMRIIVVLPG